MSDAKVPKEGEIQEGELWFNRRGNVLTVGLTNRAIDALGELEGIGLPEEGDIFDLGDAMISVDGNRGSIELAAPGHGTVTEVNPIASDPEAVAGDPLDEGWLIKYQVDDLAELGYLISEGAAAAAAKDDDDDEDAGDEDLLDEEEEEDDSDEA